MKKIFTLTIVTIFATLCSQAQVINKGDRLFGGSFSFSVFNIDNSSPGNNYNASNIGLLPAFGWAIKNNLVMGVRGSVNYYRYQSLINISDKKVVNSFTFGPGIFLKKYKTIKNKFGLYFDHTISGNYSINKEKTPAIKSKSHSWGASYAFSPGVFYKFSENFFGEANIGGFYASYYSNGSIKSYGIGASFLQQFNLGINYRIPRKIVRLVEQRNCIL